jgi:hypothetical protein
MSTEENSEESNNANEWSDEAKSRHATLDQVQP